MSDRPAIEGTVEPPGNGRTVEGEVYTAAGPGTLDDAHAPEDQATILLGKDWSLEELTPEWIIQRLMRESTDYGKRSRQTSRVAALRTLTEIMGLVDAGPPKKETPLQRALDMPAEQRRALITQRLQALVRSGQISAADLMTAAGQKAE